MHNFATVEPCAAGEHNQFLKMIAYELVLPVSLTHIHIHWYCNMHKCQLQHSMNTVILQSSIHNTHVAVFPEFLSY
jgi:hypothetical protein